MNDTIHGGDIFTNSVELDFSVNVNPLGMPEAVKKAIITGIAKDETYPDLFCRKLILALSEKEQIAQSQILCGNGASELIMAAVRAIRPKRCAVPAPAFSGYERAVYAAGAGVDYYNLSADSGYGYENVWEQIGTMEVQMLFLCNPNNPIGNRISEEELCRLLKFCQQQNIVVLVDECFLRFHKEYEQISCKRFLKDYKNLVVFNAFTKFYAMAGIRLGYLMTANERILEKIAQQLPEWNISSVAQRAGIAALTEKGYEEQTRTLVYEERAYLMNSLKMLGCLPFASEADFITFMLPPQKRHIDLKKALLMEKILIRSCETYRNMPQGCYRIVVKKHLENERLIAAIQAVLSEQDTTQK